MTGTRKPRLIDRLMAEPINMPGFPAIIVTRGYAYQYLKARGYDPGETGFGSLDYAVFAPNVSGAQLTDDRTRDFFMNKPEILEGLKR